LKAEGENGKTRTHIFAFCLLPFAFRVCS